MPKKFQGENSKAATARARKAEAKAVADARKKQQEEDALWEETDKHVLRKEQRKVSSLFGIPSCLVLLILKELLLSLSLVQLNCIYDVLALILECQNNLTTDISEILTRTKTVLFEACVFWAHI